MTRSLFALLATLLGAAALPVWGAGAPGVGSDALARLLVEKGILTQAEIDVLTKEVAAQPAPTSVSAPAAPQVDVSKWASTKGGKNLRGLQLSGRIQGQFAALSTDVAGAAVDPAETRHFFLRRIYLGAKASLLEDWSGHVNYDFAGSTFDAAFLQWKRNKEFVLDLGFRKAPFGLEEWGTSSGNLRAIERSPGTRYFVEGNNGRRLGAGSYRTGIFVSGETRRGLLYEVAITNPEREESSTGVTSVGSAANNGFATWASLGYEGKAGETTFRLNASVGFLPEQGGKVLGAGDDLTVGNLFAELQHGPFNLQLEYFGSANDHGASATADAHSRAWSIQPAWRWGDLEAVARYSFVDSDGRGVNLSDGIRSAPGGGTMDTMSEWYLGANWYVRGNDVKVQAGCLFGASDRTITGAPARATTSGFRTQVQLNF